MAYTNIFNIPNIIRNILNEKFTFLKERKVDKDTDVKLIYDIQPVTGVKFHETFWQYGDGYMTCIHLYATPDSLERHWLLDIFKLNNVISSIDIRPTKVEDTKNSIKRSVDENLSRLADAEKDANILQAKDAQSTLDRLNTLLDELEQLGNIMLAVDLRVYVIGRSFFEMEKTCSEIEQILTEDGFSKFGRNLNEQHKEYEALFYPSSYIQETLSARSGFPVPANVMALALQNYYIGWKDPRGYYLGDTFSLTGMGAVLFNPTYRNIYRTCYDMFICGLKGTGKSTMIKNFIEQMVAINNRIRVIDVTGEFKNVVMNLGGTVIRFGSEEKNILNMLEILRMDESDNQNYAKHIAKMSNIYRLMSNDCSREEIDQLQIMLKRLYVKFGIVSSEDTTDFSGVTGRNSNDYPIPSDFVSLLTEEINKLSKKETTENRIKLKILLSIRSAFESKIKTYGSLFNGHTNIPEVVDSEIISYDISPVVKINDSSVFDMELFNVMSMAFDSCMTKGLEMKSLYDTGKIIDEDIVHHFIIFDECQKTINANKLFAVNSVFDMLSQDRKYFIGVILATQNISNMCNSSSTEATNTIRKLYELCQYKIIFRQDASTLPDIEKAFVNILTPAQISEIPKLQKMEMFLNLSAEQTVRLTSKQISDNKLAYFGGGAA